MAMTQRMWRREQERRRRERERLARRRRNTAMIIIFIVIIAVIVLVAKSCSDNKTGITGEPQQTAVPVATPTARPLSTEIPLTLSNPDFYNNSVFIGNALADGISMYGILQSTDFYARVGVDLDNVYTTAADNNSMAIVDQLKSKKFSKIFLAFGETELAWNDAESFAEKYRALIEKVKSYQSNGRIYVLAIPPVTETASKQGANGVNINNVKDYNYALEEAAAELEVYYVDSYKALADNSGYLEEGVSADGINLNRNSYIRLLEYICDNAYIPDKDSLQSRNDSSESDEKETNTEDSDDDGEATEKPSATRKPSSTERPSSSKNSSSDDERPSSTSSPAPTVNVFKDSAVSDNEKSN